ncbi:diguanylate cyclase, partial [Candidatus Dependentiae bacterium]|nr:diguanylate cyclase [Candidatus Dependentiae bacterium]
MENLIIFSIILILYIVFLIILRDKIINSEHPIFIFLIFSFLSILFGNFFGGIFTYPIAIYIFTIVYFSYFLNLKYSITYLGIILLIEVLPRGIMEYKESLLGFQNLNWNNPFIFVLISISTIIIGSISRRYREKIQDDYERIFSGRIVNPDSQGKIIERSRKELKDETELSFDKNIMNLFTSLKTALDFTGIFLFLTDDNSLPSVRLQTYLSDFEDSIDLNNEIKPGTSPLSFVLKEKIPLIIPRLKTSSRALGYYLKDLNINSIFVLPIVHKKQLLGMLVCDSKQKDFFTEVHKETLTHSRDLIKGLIQNSSYSSKLINEAKESEILYEFIKTLNVPMDLNDVFNEIGIFFKRILRKDTEDNLPLRIIGIFLENKKYYTIKYSDGSFDFDITKLENRNYEIPEEGIIQNIFEFNKPVCRNLDKNEKIILNLENIEMNHSETKSFLALPLKFQKEMLGIFIMEYREPELFSEYEIKLLEVAGEHCGTIIKNITLFEKMEGLAQYDGLTNLHNHRVFQEKLSERIKRVLRNDRPLSLIMLDIDHFKIFNDTYGHSTGDEVLRAVSNVLKEQIRDIDIAARYGGEEFVLILEELNKKQAFEVAERIRFKIANTDFYLNNQHLKITMSLGIAEFPKDTLDKKELIQMADAA